MDDQAVPPSVEVAAEEAPAEALPEDDIVMEEDGEEASAAGMKLHLPLSRVKKICKLDPAVHTVSSDAAKLITMATEEYVRLMAKAAYGAAKDEGRKTIRRKDIDRVIKRDWLFALLEDAIDDWPDAKQPSDAQRTLDATVIVADQDNGENEGAIDENADVNDIDPEDNEDALESETEEEPHDAREEQMHPEDDVESVDRDSGDDSVALEEEVAALDVEDDEEDAHPAASSVKDIEDLQ
ncbi:Protein Y53F4B.3 [Aphelenchoides avenae]|nr:Protein Y53F4B.3 [Aphelenchus avenae]